MMIAGSKGHREDACIRFCNVLIFKHEKAVDVSITKQGEIRII